MYVCIIAGRHRDVEIVTAGMPTPKINANSGRIVWLEHHDSDGEAAARAKQLRAIGIDGVRAFVTKRNPGWRTLPSM